MGLIEGNKLLMGIDQSYHTLEFKCESPVLRKRWRGDASDEPVQSLISGEAVLGKDRLAVIGDEDTNTKRLRFTLHPDSPPTEWLRRPQYIIESLKKLIQDERDPDTLGYLRYLEDVYSTFADQPPTAWVGVMKANWEHGISENTWSLQAFAPRAVYDAITADILEGRCGNVTLSVQLSPTLMEMGMIHAAPPNWGVTVFILRQGKHDGGTGWGRVTGITWRPSELVATVPEVSSEDADKEPEPSARTPISAALDAQQLAIDASLASAHHSIQSLARTVTRGFVLVLILLVLNMLFR